MGTDEDIEWFQQFLDDSSEVLVRSNSENLKNKGTTRYKRRFIDVERADIIGRVKIRHGK